MVFDKKQLQNFPIAPGVYLMKDALGAVVYVGKAINIRSRVRQYFNPGSDSRVQIPYLLEVVETIDTIVVSSEKEALLLENTLIKQHKPKYNVFLKDDKSFICLKINKKTRWPRVQIVRANKVRSEAHELYFGPFTNSYAARKTLETLWSLFPLRRCDDKELNRRTRPCMLYQIKRCLGPCVNLCSSDQYQKAVEGVIEFLQGKDTDLLEQMRSKMKVASDSLEFEKAQEYWDQIKLLEVTIEQQKVYRIGVKDHDIWGLYREGPLGNICCLMVRSGQLSHVDHNSFSNSYQSDEELLESFLLLYYGERLEPPSEILLPVTLQGEASLEEIFKQQYQRSIRVLFPQKGEKKQLLNMAYENAKTEFVKKHQEGVLIEAHLEMLKNIAQLRQFPFHIECIDLSHLFTTQMVGACISFKEGVTYKKGYRHYHIKESKAGDDYGAMREVLKRRLLRGKEEGDIPDLIILDGGKGQLNVGVSVLEELDLIHVDIVSLVKESSRHDKGMVWDSLCVPGVAEPIGLESFPEVLFLLQKIRDEAHRFAITFQKKQRTSSLKSILENISGLGPKKIKNLYLHLGSLDQIKSASQEVLMEVPLISQKDAQAILDYFRSSNV